ncbi:uncharacterized protein LOC103714759 isoform X2 [Phoenix dactylifera]|uniref:Uncharacterized protein LOC103714759 isoform X2 n=1 Tax=Phoenix dactylifera TaxID=42345 RepID=A0A8B9AS80_PHODC|nr:uncharacterized protein LOC103714759 isoform X2 [Phoenix dactylifera]
MRPVDDKAHYIYGSAQDNPICNSYNLEFQNGNAMNKARSHRKVVGSRTKPTPSKWDDAQKWLVGLSGGGYHCHSNSKPRNSNADDRRLLAPMPPKGRDSFSSADGALEVDAALEIPVQDEGEMKKIECHEPFWRIDKPVEDSAMEVRSVCVRDMGTEMTPIASKEPSRAGTPLGAATPVLRSPISSRPSTPARRRQGARTHESYQEGIKNLERKGEPVFFGKVSGELDASKISENKVAEQIRNLDSLESRAMAWDEAECAKYKARYKREEVNIQAWENHEKRKAEMEMRRMEIILQFCSTSLYVMTSSLG